jgi:hypothetical protein
MKRITRKSLIAALSLTSLVTSMSADNLSEAFTNGKIKGEIKSVYSNSNFLGNEKSSDISTAGGNLAYKTADFYGFSSGVTFQTSHMISEDNNKSIFASDLDASGSVLSEAFLEYKLSNTRLKAGRQFIYTPLVSSAIDGRSSESLVKDSFEAYMITNTDLPNTTIVAAYVDKYQEKASAGNIGSFDQYEDGAYTFYAKNTSLKDITLQGQYLKVNASTDNSDIKDLYLQADYQLAAHTLSAQYLKSTDESQVSNKEDGQLFGIRAKGPIGIEKLGYIVAFSSSTKDGDVNSGIGSGTDDIVFESMPVNGSVVHRRGNTDTLIGGIIVPIFDVTTVAYAGNSWSNDSLFGDVSAAGAMAIYPFYKNFLLKANYEHVETENTIAAAGIVEGNTDVTRVYLSYKF